MSQLRALTIRKEILDLCGFFDCLIRDYDLEYREGMSKEEGLTELVAVRENISSGGEFTLAFVGEYSAGKTTLINLLTGADMEVGTSTTTDQATKLQWHNITIVDTPGMGSGFTEHDEVTKKWLAKADLLVYVLTPDLFNSQSGERFVQLLDEFKRDHELMLVMNMIDQEGNDLAVYAEELQRVLDPRPLENYYPTFISAEFQKKSQDKQIDKEDREYFASKSHFQTFVDTLDHFILERHEKASLSTPLNRIQVLSRKIGFKNRFDKENALLDRQISMYEGAVMEIRAVSSDLKETLRGLSLGTSGDIFMQLDNPGDDFKAALEQCLSKFGGEVEEAVKDASLRLADTAQRIHGESATITGSELFAQVQEAVNSQETLKGIFQDISIPTQNGVEQEEMTEKLRRTLNEFEGISGVSTPDAVKDTLKAKNAFDLTAKLAAKVDRNLVLKMGHQIGYKFKPWQAVKLSTKVGKAVPYVNVAAVAFELVSANRKKKRQEERNRQLREFKQDIREMLDNAAADTITMIEKMLLGPITGVAEGGCALLRDKKIQLLEYSEQSKEMSLELESKRNQCLALHQHIYEPA